MVTYTVNNSRGSVVAEIPISSINTSATPLALVGQGFSLYGEYTAENFVKLCEHFANTTPPGNPLDGTIWYDTTSNLKRLNYWNGIRWIPIASGYHSMGFLFPRLPTANNVDFTIAATTPIFTAPGNGEKYYPTGVMLIPSTTPSASGPTAFNLNIDTAEDVLDNSVITSYGVNKHAFFSIEGATRFASGTDTISIEVSTPVDPMSGS